LDFATPPTSYHNHQDRYDDYEVEKYTAPSRSASDSDNDADTSSPFMSQVRDRDDQENAPPPKLRPASRVLSGAELSPLKLLQDRPKAVRSSLGSDENTATLSKPVPLPISAAPRSPRKMSSPEKRFPVKVSATPVVSPTEETPRAVRVQPVAVDPAPQQEEDKRTPSMEEVVHENTGLKHAIDIFEDAVSVPDEQTPSVGSDATTLGADDNDNDLVRVDSDEVHQQSQQDDYDYDYEQDGDMNDTMISTFSTFSAVPNLTMFANMRGDNSPAKLSSYGLTPRGATTIKPDLAPLRTPRATAGPLPNRSAPYESGGNTTNLLDFTENLRLGAYAPSSPSRRSGRSSPFRSGVPSTPQRGGNSNNNNSVNLLDFDIPPLPTPRSIPTITPRELESLKSSFLSEISSLKASLSGKEAEAASLKTAVGDAEKRVGECMEQLREARSAAETLGAERESWERRGREMEAVLRKVKEEIVLGQRDREELEARLEESEKRRDAAETMAQEAESRIAGMKAGRLAGENNGGTPVRGSPGQGTGGSNKEVEIAVERVARELHALYKGKHETKVAALKKSYENRWEKRVRELEGRIAELERENEELRVGRDVTMTRVDPAALARVREEVEEERKSDRQRIAGLEAEVERLEAVVRSVKDDNEGIRGLLERERVEKGELVMLAEEMMSMQQSFVGAPERRESENRVAGTPATARKTMATPSKGRSGMMGVPASPSVQEGHGFRGSLGTGTGGGGMKPSGLRAPGTAGASRIGKVGGSHARTGSAVNGNGMRSGLLSSIEKMGSYRGRAE
jgi:hypothetical protein